MDEEPGPRSDELTQHLEAFPDVLAQHAHHLQCSQLLSRTTDICCRFRPTLPYGSVTCSLRLFSGYDGAPIEAEHYVPSGCSERVTVHKTGTSAQAIQTTLRQVVALVFTGAPAKLSGRFGIVIVD